MQYDIIKILLVSIFCIMPTLNGMQQPDVDAIKNPHHEIELLKSALVENPAVGSYSWSEGIVLPYNIINKKVMEIDELLKASHQEKGDDLSSLQKALLLASRYGLFILVESLLAHVVDPNTPTSRTYPLTPLLEASKNRCLRTILILLNAGAHQTSSVDSATEHITPLFVLATYSGNIPYITEKLIEAGDDPNFMGHSCYGLEETVLHRAAKAKNDRMVSILLDNGADPTLLTQSGISPLSFIEQFRLRLYAVCKFF